MTLSLKGLDEVELDYVQAIKVAIRKGDNDRAQDLSIGLSQYRQSYKEY